MAARTRTVGVTNEDMLEEVLSQHSAGSSFNSSSRAGSPTPPWKKWSNSLSQLLEDPEGLELFRLYLEEEKAVQPLYFHLACKGLAKQTEARKRSQLMSVIYKTFVQKAGALDLMPETQEKLDKAFRENGPNLDSRVFDEAQQEAFRVMEQKLHPNFILSEKYQSYVNSQICDNQESGVSSPYVNDQSPHSSPQKEVPEPNPQASVRSVAHPDSGLSMQSPLTPQAPNPAPFPPSSSQPPELPPKLSSFSGKVSGSLTKGALLASAAARQLEDERKTHELGDTVGQLNAPYYSKYNAFTLPSARESEVHSQFSDTARQRQMGVGANRDIIDFSTMEKLAEKNRIEKTQFLPTTHFQRVQSNIQPKECDPNQRLPQHLFAAQLSAKLEKLAVSSQQESPLAESNAGVRSATAIDDSERILDEHLAKIKTPDSIQSQCASPNPPIRKTFGEQNMFPSSFAPTGPQSTNAFSRTGGFAPTNFEPTNIGSFNPTKDLFRSTVDASRPGQIHAPFKETTWKPPPAPLQKTSFSAMPSAGQIPSQFHPTMSRHTTDTDSGLGPSDVGVSHFAPTKPTSGAQPAFSFPANPTTIKPASRNSGNLASRSQRTGASSKGAPASSSAYDRSLNRTKSADGRRQKDQQTTVLWRYGQEGEFFMTKLIGKQTLKNFKTVLPVAYRNEQVRFYFKKDIDGLSAPVWEEIVSDSDTLPLHEGRVTATIEKMDS